MRNANSPPKGYEPTPIQIYNEEFERHGAHRMLDDMEIEDETPSVSRTVQRIEFNPLDEPYHVLVPILNMSPQQKKMKIPLTLISASYSTFLLQMIEVLPQIMEQTSSRELILHHYNDENLLMDNFYIDSDQEYTFNHIVMEYLQLHILNPKAIA